jgi:hypothetical protein
VGLSISSLTGYGTECVQKAINPRRRLVVQVDGLDAHKLVHEILRKFNRVDFDGERTFTDPDA